jgi:hypothetical protein
VLPVPTINWSRYQVIDPPFVLSSTLIDRADPTEPYDESGSSGGAGSVSHGGFDAVTSVSYLLLVPYASTTTVYDLSEQPVICHEKFL